MRVDIMCTRHTVTASKLISDLLKSMCMYSLSLICSYITCFDIHTSNFQLCNSQDAITVIDWDTPSLCDVMFSSAAAV